MTIGQYIAQRAAAMRAAREDTSTEEAGHSIEFIPTGGQDWRKMTRQDFDDRMPLVLFEAVERDSHGGRHRKPRRSRICSAWTSRGRVRVGGETMDPIGDDDRPRDRCARQRPPRDSRAGSRQRPDAARAAMTGSTRGAVAVPEARAIVIGRRPIDGNKLLTDTYTALNHFAVWPNEAALVTAVLWAAHAHGKDDKTKLPIWQYSPRLFFTSKEGGSGKSWMGRLVAKLSPDGKMFVEATKASLQRLIAKQCTVVVTELDVLVGNGGRTKWFTGIANAGYERDQATYRVDHGKELEIPLMCPMILDGLETVITATGAEMKTLMSRCIIIHAKRAPDGYRAPRFDNTARAVFQMGSENSGSGWASRSATASGMSCPRCLRGSGARQSLGTLVRGSGCRRRRLARRARQACADLESRQWMRTANGKPVPGCAECVGGEGVSERCGRGAVSGKRRGRASALARSIAAEAAFRARVAELGGAILGPYVTQRPGRNRCKEGHACWPWPNSVLAGRHICRT